MCTVCEVNVSIVIVAGFFFLTCRYFPKQRTCACLAAKCHFLFVCLFVRCSGNICSKCELASLMSKITFTAKFHLP